MDKRLELTDEQRIAMNRYNNAVKELLESGVRCVFRTFDEIAVINGKEVGELAFEEDFIEDADNEVVRFDELEQIECPFGLNLNCNEKTFVVWFENL